MNIDNLMDQLAEAGASADEVMTAFKAAQEKKTKRDNALVEKARANVMQALRKYISVLYGEVDEAIMNEFETTLKGLEKSVKKPNTFHMEMKSGDLDDAKLEKFFRALGY